MVSVSSGSYIYVKYGYGLETVKRQTRATYGCMTTGESPCFGVCDDSAAEAAFVALCKRALPLHFHLYL